MKSVIKISCLLVVLIAILVGSMSRANTNINSLVIQEKLAALEVESGGWLGLSSINTENNMKIDYRADRRFPVQSTFKVLVVGAVLKESMRDEGLLEERIMYSKDDLVFWSPITGKNISKGMTISELCAAAIIYSDNTATNLLVKKMGGLEVITTFAKSVGDGEFRLDHWEPEMNSNPEDMQDTSTPTGMRISLQNLIFGDVLAKEQREKLIIWLVGNTTGDNRIRAGVPNGWVVGDKTGGGMDYGVTNDIGIIWPPNCKPIVIAMYLVQKQKDASRREDIIASATQVLINEYTKNDQCMRINEEN